MVRAYIALGSNLGYRRVFLDRALQALREGAGIVVTRVSSWFETAAVGGPAGQGDYLNGVAELQTDLGPEEVLRRLLAIEQGLGRVRHERFGPRTIDLDLLLHGERVLDTPELTLPHPRLHERLFVLVPLVEIVPDLIHPVLGRSLMDLLSELRNQTAAARQCEPRPIGTDSGSLAGLKALVTGSTSGIGRAIVAAFAAAGADVIVHGRRSLEAAASVASRVRDQGRRSAVLRADLREPEQCRELVERAWAEWGGLDIWVNNAGADTLTGEAARWSFDRKLQELLRVDVEATIRLARDVGARMKQAWGGVILTLGWDQAETGMEGDSGQLFATAKGAVMAFTRSLAMTLAPEVRVNCLAPGWIRTAWGEQASAAWQERARRETPLRRWGRPEDIAAAACWLASPAAAFMTGQIIRVNGGAVR